MSDERALKALTRLRHIETDEARRALAETLAEETALLDRDATLAAAAIAARTVAGEYDRDSFAAFLARVRAERETLAAALRATEARTAAARMALGPGGWPRRQRRGVGSDGPGAEGGNRAAGSTDAGGCGARVAAAIANSMGNNRPSRQCGSTRPVMVRAGARPCLLANPAPRFDTGPPTP